jgi:hypothetical protein
VEAVEELGTTERDKLIVWLARAVGAGDRPRRLSPPGTTQNAVPSGSIRCMATRPDILLFDREGRRLLVAEAKNKRNTSPTWAAELRRNLLAHEGFRHAEFFLVLTPDHLYLWRGMSADPVPVPPDYVVDSRPLFLPYLQRAGLDLDRISSPVFELMAISWLSDLVHSKRESETVGNDEAWLVQSGLLDAVRNGRLAHELAA